MNGAQWQQLWNGLGDGRMKKVTTALAKKNINQLLTIVNQGHDTIEVENPSNQDSAVMVSMKDWLQIVSQLAKTNHHDMEFS
ncbi:type II toxin-antitoxin system Phd/YefM family antitoxin [Lactiplantibacillus plantarum]|nr:type II toxin-antitoxin system Phd/YefM family antitoxin [Lactiplantibacillus plantarum]RXS60504.1 type II toxin-antitoxin system Phd/YefM family antitoxin [Lactiplantibacillus plantarum]